MLIISGSLTFAPADREFVLEKLAKVTELSRRDAGCVEYWWSEDLESPNTFRFFECWDSQEVFDSHIAAPHETDFGEHVLPLITGATATMFSATPHS